VNFGEFPKNPPLQFSRLQAYNLRGLSSKWTEPNLTELNATRRHLHVAWWVPDPPIESETSFRRQVWSLENFTWLPFSYRFKLGSVCCRYGRPSWQLLFFFFWLTYWLACAQTLYALRVLRKHGLCNDSLHDIFRAVAVAKLTYASNAWFSNANDRQKIFAFTRRCIRTGFCSPDLADFHDLYISSDEKLFNKILTCPNLSYGLSCHHRLHKITVLEKDLTTDSYVTAFIE